MIAARSVGSLVTSSTSGGKNPPQPFATCPNARLAAATRLYFDVDDTLTKEGGLYANAVAALYAARDAGMSLVAVTGRSAAWGEMLARVFPLDAVIAETGAICFYEQNGALKTMHSEENAAVRKKNAQTRADAAETILSTVPEARLAVDNMGRLYDTAFDLIEDGAPVSADAATTIRDMLKKCGMQVAQSSVHINAWFGAFDKATMVDRYLREVEGTDLDEAAPTMMYMGDSKNDASMFARAELSIGVQNVAPHIEALCAQNAAPRFIAEGHGGDGFAEVCAALCAAKAGGASQ